MKDYASMSDFEVNRRVSIAMGERFDIQKKPKPSPYLEITETTVSLLNCDGTRIERAIVRDYCNNPADAWPILLENEISLVKWQHDDVWAAWSGAGMSYGEVESDYSEHDKNPLRAGMIVFLMMKEGE